MNWSLEDHLICRECFWEGLESTASTVDVGGPESYGDGKVHRPELESRCPSCGSDDLVERSEATASELMAAGLADDDRDDLRDLMYMEPGDKDTDLGIS